MTTIAYNSYIDDVQRGLILNLSATIKVMLVSPTYIENKRTHMTRADVAGEIAAGNGYTAGGNTIVLTINKDSNADRINVVLGGTVWTTSSGQVLTARKAVYYVSTGSAATDRLIAVNDFQENRIASQGGLFTLNSTIIPYQN